MTLAQLRDQIRTLRAQARTTAQGLAEAATNDQTPLAQLDQAQQELVQLNNRIGALQSAYDAQAAEEGEGASNPSPATQALDRRGRARQMLASNEYARAFAYAIRNGVIPARGGSDPNCQILYNALTEAGGDPAGEDGGFLVPEDIDHTIREMRRGLNPLADLFTQESVSTNKGWRVMDTAPSKGFTKLTSEIPSGEIAQDDQPEFVKVPFSLDTYGLIVPVSNELAADEVANLFGYLARWFVRKQIITENLLLKTMLETLTASNIGAATAMDDIKRVLNRTLDPAISLTSKLLCNQDAFDYLDTLKDTTGRPLLQPDPTNETITRFKGRQVHVVSNAVLPSRTATTSGATKGDYYPVYIGDFSQYATIFTRQGLEVRSTDIGGKAFRTNSIEVRGITRLGTAKFDGAAVARREIFIAAEEPEGV